MFHIYSNKMLDFKKDRPNDETPFAKHRGGDHWVCPLSVITLKAVFGAVLYPLTTLLRRLLQQLFIGKCDRHLVRRSNTCNGSAYYFDHAFIDIAYAHAS